MKAKVTGKSAWQKVPQAATLDIKVHRRYADSSGNATVGHYSGVLNGAKDGFVNPFDNSDLWIVVQGPDDPPAVLATFFEVVTYDADHVVRTEFTRTLISSDLDGLTFDYAMPEPDGVPLGFGDAPLTMRAAADLLEQGEQQQTAVAQGLTDLAADRTQIRADTDEAIARTDAAGVQAMLLSGTRLYKDDAARTADAAPPANGGFGYVISTRTYWQRVNNAWVNLGVAAVSFSEAQGISNNLLPDGGDILVNGAGLKRRLAVDYAQPVRGPIGPMGGATVLNPSGGWSSWSTGLDLLPVPADRGGIRVRVYLKAAVGHTNNIRLIPVKRDGTELYGAESGGANLPSTLNGIGTTGDGFKIVEFIATPTWPADCIGFSVTLNLNQTKAAGQSEVGGIILTPASATYSASPVALQAPAARTLRGGWAESEVYREMQLGNTFPVPTEATAWTEWGFELVPVGVWADVQNWIATGEQQFLERCIPSIDAVFAVRDDKRSTPRADFAGTVRPLWGTNQYQPGSETDRWVPVKTGIGAGNDIPHPEAFIHFPLHQALTIYPILLWIEQVRSSRFLPQSMQDKAIAWQALCLETLHALDGQFATHTHETNTDLQPIVAGEGRYFMKYDSNTVSKDGYGYIAGGEEMPVNMDCQMAAALYTAYRILRGTTLNPTAEAQAFKDKADMIMRRLKRSTYWMDGALGWYYVRPGVWYNTAWNGAAPANNPYAKGWTRWQSNNRTDSVAYGEDWDHVSVTLRGVGEYARTSSGIFTEDELCGFARAAALYWVNARSMKTYFLPTPLKGWTTTTQQTLTHRVGNVPQGLVWTAHRDAKLRGMILEWYASGLTPRRPLAGALRAAGLL